MAFALSPSCCRFNVAMARFNRASREAGSARARRSNSARAAAKSYWPMSPTPRWNALVSRAAGAGRGRSRSQPAIANAASNASALAALAAALGIGDAPLDRGLGELRGAVPGRREVRSREIVVNLPSQVRAHVLAPPPLSPPPP